MLRHWTTFPAFLSFQVLNVCFIVCFFSSVNLKFNTLVLLKTRELTFNHFQKPSAREGCVLSNFIFSGVRVEKAKTHPEPQGPRSLSLLAVSPVWYRAFWKMQFSASISVVGMPGFPAEWASSFAGGYFSLEAIQIKSSFRFSPFIWHLTKTMLWQLDRGS